MTAENALNNKISNYRILIWSENPDKLQTFYRDVLELEPFIKLELPDDYGYAFKIGDTDLLLWIGRHSEISGKNKDPYRHIFNLYVDDVQVWYEKLKRRDDVTIVQKPVVTPPTRGTDDEKFVFTFLDPEGNCLQFTNP